MCLFLLMILLGALIRSFSLDGNKMWAQHNGIEDLIIGEEFEGAQYLKNFHEVMTPGEVWTFIEGPVLKGL